MSSSHGALCRAGLLVAILTAGCSETESNGNLDSISARGDSIAALAMRGFTSTDSAAAMAVAAQQVRDEISSRTRDTSELGRARRPAEAAAETAAGQVIVGTSESSAPPPVADLPSPTPIPTPAPTPVPPISDARARARALGDTVRGVVAVVGAASMSQVTIQVAQGGSVMLNGMAVGDIGRLAGAEVVARGVRTSPGELVVADYSVRRIDGVDATDGLLIAAADGLMLSMRDGERRRVSNAPAGLQALVGTRVWIAGSLERPTAFGRISRGR
jgi:hypothetical protein